MANHVFEKLLDRPCFTNEERLMIRFLFMPTPWLVELWPEEIARQIDIVAWCGEEIGDRSNPLRGKPGDWRINELKGRTWIGFRTRRQMLAFKKYRKSHQESDTAYAVRRPIIVSQPHRVGTNLSAH